MKIDITDQHNDPIKTEIRSTLNWNPVSCHNKKNFRNKLDQHTKNDTPYFWFSKSIPRPINEPRWHPKQIEHRQTLRQCLLTCTAGDPWCCESLPWSVQPASPGFWSIPSQSLPSSWRNPGGPAAAGPSSLSAGPDISAAPPTGPGSLMRRRKRTNILGWSQNVTSEKLGLHIFYKCRISE